jgi:hypothetical protein
MSVKRYKINKDQLERVVESFVMESAKIESKKAPVKDHIPAQGSEAKKHIKNKMSGKMVEKGQGVPTPTTMKKKLSQAPESKKHISKAKASYTNKAKVVKEGEGEQDVAGVLKSAGLPVNQKVLDYAQQVVQKMGPEKVKAALEKAGLTDLEDLKGFIEKSKSSVEAKADAVKSKLAPALKESRNGSKVLNESWLSDNKGKIGMALAGLGLAGLGIAGGMQEHLTNLMSNDTVIKQVLTDPLWISSIVASLLGVGLTSSAVVDTNKANIQKANLEKVSLAKRQGYTEIVSGDAAKGEYPVIFKNPKTGKSIQMAKDGTITKA